MKPTACLHPNKGEVKAILRQAIPYPKGPQRYPHEGDRSTGINGSDEVATILALDLSFINNPKK